MSIATPRTRNLIFGAIVLAIVVGAALWYATRGAREVGSLSSAAAPPARPLTHSPRSPDSIPAATNTSESAGAIAGSAAAYPVDQDWLRARLPDNRYWALGAPTSDPAVAKARAARAERDNTELGHIQANEATPAQIRAYYAERRAISRDYLQVAELVLTERGDALPERDRGLFELTLSLHRARLQQIDRDERDALGRIGAR